MNQISRRKSKRHDIHASQAIKIKVRRFGTLSETTEQELADGTVVEKAPTEMVDATILDVSRNGLKLQAKTGFEFHERVVLEINRKNGSQICVAAQVRWVEPQASGKKWVAGCLIASEFPPDYIDEMAESGMLERRASPRQSIQKDAMGRWEMTQKDCDISIVDVSGSGVAILIDEIDSIGKRIRITFSEGMPEEVRMTAKAVWQKPVDGRFLVGCEIIEGSTYKLLGQAVAKEYVDQVKRHRTYESMTFIGVSAMIVLLIRQMFF